MTRPDPMAGEPPALGDLVGDDALAELCSALSALSGLTVQIVPDTGPPRGPRIAQDARREELPIAMEGRPLATLVVADPDGSRAVGDLSRRAREASRILELLLVSGQRAHLTSAMHLASSVASYRELAEKTERLQQAFDKLKEVDRLKSTFLATISHELRTPLTSIIGYSEMLASGMGGPLGELAREFVDTIRAKGDHLLELIVSLLDVAKLERDEVQLHLTPVRPAELADDVVRTVSPAAAKKGVALEHRVLEQLPEVSADKARLRQVLLNLMDNAVKFTPEGGTVTLELSPATLPLQQPEADEAGLVLLGAPEPAVQFAVRDTGIGIPNTEHERIFEAFYQVDGSTTRAHGGTGLGLAIVKRLVEAHGGTIELASTSGVGTEFVVRIPAVHASETS